MYVRHATRGIGHVLAGEWPSGSEVITVHFGASSTRPAQLVPDGDGWTSTGPFAEGVRRADCTPVPDNHPDVEQFNLAWKIAQGLDVRDITAGMRVRHKTLGVGTVAFLAADDPLRVAFVRFGGSGAMAVFRRDCEIA